MRRFVFDCDTGTDDAIALLAAFGSPEIEILGITSVNGNVIEDHVANNNLNLCEYLGFDVPTYAALMMLVSWFTLLALNIINEAHSLCPRIYENWKFFVV